MATLNLTFMDALVDLLLDGGEDAVLTLLEAHLGKATTPVPLPEADLTPEEALEYARGLFDLGRSGDGRAVLADVVRHATGQRHELAVDLPQVFRAAA